MKSDVMHTQKDTVLLWMCSERTKNVKSITDSDEMYAWERKFYLNVNF